VTQNSATESSPKHRERIRWGCAILLALPAALPYLTHYLYARAHGRVPTGFLIRDMPYYMANARAHFAGGHFHLLYQLPFSPYDNTPAIYFQPHTLLLGLFWKISHLEVNVLFLIFSAIAAVVCARVAIALYEQLIGLESFVKRVGLLIFFWGGGALVLSGAIKLWLFGPGTEAMVFERYFDVDPFRGLWFLNFGRNLIFGTEAYYHALFFGAVLLAFRRRFIASAIIALLLSMSHPFTGLELLLILLSWAIFETLILRKRAMPAWYPIAIAAILGLHLVYYLWFLQRSPEHASVAKAWAQAYILHLPNALAAYGFVLAFAIATVRTSARFRHYFAEPSHRLLAMWFLVAFALANHDLVMKPLQPLHFTRGYIWTPLFLMGAPSLVALIDYLRTRLKALGMIAIVALVAVFLLDNGLWLTTLYKRPDVITDGPMLTPGRWEMLQKLKDPKYEGCLVLSQDLDLGYLVTAYTNLRSWYSHFANTPYLQERVDQLRMLFSEGVYLNEWRTRPTLIILRRDYTPEPPAWLDAIGAKLVEENSEIRVYRVEPANPR
jgi:hypothetical protein